MAKKKLARKAPIHKTQRITKQAQKIRGPGQKYATHPEYAKPPAESIAAPSERNRVFPEFPIVGIGASAGGLEACSQLLHALPPNPGIAFIVVQHLAPKHDSLLPQLLAAATPVSVVEAIDGTEVRPNHVYVTPPNRQIAIDMGNLRLLPRPADRSQYMPIDFFFRSLAAYAGPKAIGVTLSGTASDSALGLREIKAADGIAIAQDPKTAKFEGMPQSAIATGVVDLILSPEDMAKELMRLAEHPLVRAREVDRPIDAVGPMNDDQLHRIFSLLRDGTGVDFTHYKQPTIL